MRTLLPVADDDPPQTLAAATEIANRICKPAVPATSGADRYYHDASADLLGALLFAAAAADRPMVRTTWGWLNDGDAPDREIRPLLEDLAADMDQPKGRRANAIYALATLPTGRDHRMDAAIRLTAQERFRNRVLADGGGAR